MNLCGKLCISLSVQIRREIEQRGEGLFFLFFFLLFSLYWSLKHVYIFIGKVHTEVQADSLVGRGSGKTGLLTY